MSNAKWNPCQNLSWFFSSPADPWEICSPWRLWFDSPVVLDLVPPWYLWHVDIKWFPRQAAPIFQSPLSSGYLALGWKGAPLTNRRSQIQQEENNCNYIREPWAAAISWKCRSVNIVHIWPLDLSQKRTWLFFARPCQMFTVDLSCQLEELCTFSPLFSLT